MQACKPGSVSASWRTLIICLAAPLLMQSIGLPALSAPKGDQRAADSFETKPIWPFNS